MNHEDIDVDAVLEEIDIAIERGDYRKATEQERMELRLAVLAYEEGMAEETDGKDRQPEEVEAAHVL